MTGSYSLGEFAAVQTFRYRQSSLVSPRPLAVGNSSEAPVRAGWEQVEENRSALRTPSQFAAGRGACHRRVPTGGAAKGMPLKTRTPESDPGAPATRPVSSRTG